MAQQGNTIAAVLFDMDETVIEHTSSVLEVLQGTYHAFAEELAGVEEAQFIQVLGSRAQDMWYMMEDGVLDGDVARLYMMVNTLRAVNMDLSLADAMLVEFEDRLVAKTRLADDALEVLDTLREAGLKVGIVTNGFTTMQTRKIEHHGLQNHTDFVVISEAVGSFKPDRGIFDEALSRANAGVSEALFVGDNLDTDIAGALGVGMGAILIDPKGERVRRLEEDASLGRPSHVVTCLTEVLHLAGVDGRPGPAR